MIGVASEGGCCISFSSAMLSCVSSFCPRSHFLTLWPVCPYLLHLLVLLLFFNFVWPGAGGSSGSLLLNLFGLPFFSLYIGGNGG